MEICRSLRSLSSLLIDTNLGARSVTTEIGPGCLTAVVSVMIPALRLMAFSDGRIVEEIKDVKWSIMRRIFCPSLLITSA